MKWSVLRAGVPAILRLKGARNGTEEHCQAKEDQQRSKLPRCDFTPFGKCGCAVRFENVSAVEMTVMVEVVMALSE
jgi:hypothetical protein